MAMKLILMVGSVLWNKIRDKSKEENGYPLFANQRVAVTSAARLLCERSTERTPKSQSNVGRLRFGQPALQTEA